MPTSIAHCLGFIGTCLSVLCSIISLALPYWIRMTEEYTSYTGTIVYQGLWSACVQGRFSTSCHPIRNPESWFKAVRAFMILGTLALLPVLVCVFLAWCAKMSEKLVRSAPVFLTALGGVFTFIAVLVYGAKNSHLEQHLHAGFGLAIVAVVLDVIDTLLLLIAKRAPDPTA